MRCADRSIRTRRDRRVYRAGSGARLGAAQAVRSTLASRSGTSRTLEFVAQAIPGPVRVSAPITWLGRSQIGEALYLYSGSELGILC